MTLRDLRCGAFTAGGTGVLIAKSHVLKATMFDENLPRYQDWDLFIRIAEQHEIGYLNRPLVRYNGGGHARITNRHISRDPGEALRAAPNALQARNVFGRKWFRRHMCRALMYNFRTRPDKVKHLCFAAWHSGAINVAIVLWERMRKDLDDPITVAARNGPVGAVSHLLFRW